MTFEIVTTPANTPASLLFQQCLVEIVPDNKIMNMAKEEVAGYFLDKIEPTIVSEDLWMKVLNKAQIKKQSRINTPTDPFLNQLPVSLQVHLADKKIKWKSFKDVKIATILPKDNNEKLELIHVMPGAKIPQHTHEGNESFLVLHGSYSDEYGSYKQGTVQVRSDDHHHTPIGHTQTGCVGLAYTHGKIKFSGKFGKLLNLIAN
ncbi:cupin domain-containing protein [Alphaproteobacteria bacterium]|jgi:putative transcriptional regulator|nr:cupin domain-containing protein [Alphaproteobacteria bacterium]